MKKMRKRSKQRKLTEERKKNKREENGKHLNKNKKEGMKSRGENNRMKACELMEARNIGRGVRKSKKQID